MSESAGNAVFLSYASQDVESAKRICEALRASGVEVWFDQSELVGGDQWDHKIRGQVKSCTLFVPIISAATQARLEGYFRLEWKLAAQRTHTMADAKPFLLPVVIDATRDAEAHVPEEFRAVQWTRLRPAGYGGQARNEPALEVFCARVKTLLGGVAVCGTRERFANADTPGETHKRSATKTKRGWFAPAVIVTVVLALAAVAIFRPRRTPEEVARVIELVKDLGAKAGATKTAAAPVAPPALSLPNGLSPARELAAKALVVLNGVEVTREDLALAEDYCQRALKLDSTAGEVWAAASQANSTYVYRGWDTTPERREQVRVMAERAIRLSPASPQAKVAQAGAWSTFGINRAETEKLLREVVAERPADQAALRFLAVTVLNRGGFDECLALNERSAALPGGDPLALFNNARYLWQGGRQAEAYAMVGRSLTQKPFGSALVLKAHMEMTWRGDLATAEATLQQIPQSMLLEDRANFVAGLLRFFQRRAGAAIEAWGSFPRDYYRDFAFDGPKGLLVGLAHELDRRDAAAKIEWRTALQAVEKRMAAAPNNASPYYYKAYLLACLGDKAGAEEALRTHEELAGLKYTTESPMASKVALVYARLGRFDDIFAFPPSLGFSRIDIDPRFEALRADPRYQKLLAEKQRQDAEGKK